MQYTAFHVNTDVQQGTNDVICGDSDVQQGTNDVICGDSDVQQGTNDVICGDSDIKPATINQIYATNKELVIDTKKNFA